MEGLIAAIAIYTIFVPLVTGHFAMSRGRSFWLWFALCYVIPILPMLLLPILPDKSKPEEKKTDEPGS